MVKKPRKIEDDEEYKIIETPPEIMKLLDKKSNTEEPGRIPIRIVRVSQAQSPSPERGTQDYDKETIFRLDDFLKSEQGVDIFLKYMESLGIPKILRVLSKHFDKSYDEFVKADKEISDSFLIGCGKANLNNAEVLASTFIIIGAILSGKEAGDKVLKRP